VVRIARLLSPTAINTYLACPRKYYLRYFKKLPSRPSIHLIRGNVVHKVIARFNQTWRKPMVQTSSLDLTIALLKIFEEVWEKARPSMESLGLPAEELQDFRDESQLMVINFGFWLERYGIAPPRQVEKRFISQRLHLMGIVDAEYNIGGETILVDFKTSRKADITPEVQRQAALYAMLFEDINGQPPADVWIHFLKFQDDPLPVGLDEELMQYGRQVLALVEQKTVSTREEDYPCTCGGYCHRDFVMR